MVTSSSSVSSIKRARVVACFKTPPNVNFRTWGAVNISGSYDQSRRAEGQQNREHTFYHAFSTFKVTAF